MIIFLYGRDGYRLKQNLEKITTEYRKKNTGMSFSVLDFDSDAPGRLEKLTDLIKTVSFFDEKRLIVLKSAFVTGEKIAGLIANWKLSADKQRVLVFTENSGEEELRKKDKKLFGLLLAKPNIAKSFEPPEGKSLEDWARKEIESLDGKIDPAALKELISYVTIPHARNEPPEPTTTWRLKQEIDKLVNYKSATGGPIDAGDIELLVNPTAGPNIFEVVDAVAGRNRYRATAALHRQLEAGTDPFSLFSMIVYQFRNLLRVKALMENAVPYAGIVKKTGLHPYVVKKTCEQCKKFGLDELKKLFGRLAQMDLAVKTGEIDLAEGLYQFIFSPANTKP